jgi:hypothetical protein
MLCLFSHVKNALVMSSKGEGNTANAVLVVNDGYQENGHWRLA